MRLTDHAWSYKAWCSAVISCLFQQLWLVHFRSCCSFIDLLPWQSAVAWLSCCCVFILLWASTLLEFLCEGICTVFKLETMLRSQLVQPKDAVDPAKQDGVVYRIPCECSKVYIGETRRPMQDRIKEHHWDIWLACIKTSAVSEHAHNTGHKPLWNEVKFIDHDPYYYTYRVKDYVSNTH